MYGITDQNIVSGNFTDIHILFYIYDKLKSSNYLKVRLEEELEDYRGWYDNEAAFRVKGIVNRLSKFPQYQLDLTHLHIGRLDPTSIIDFINQIPSPDKLGSIAFAELSGTDLRGINFSKSDAHHINLRNTDLDDAQFIDSNLTNAFLTQAEGIKVKFQHANLSRATMREVVFKDSKFDSATLKGAFMNQAVFEECTFYSADLRDSDLLSTQFGDCKFGNNAKFEGAKVMNLSFIHDLDNSDLLSKYTVTAERFIDPISVIEHYKVSINPKWQPKSVIINPVRSKKT